MSTDQKILDSLIRIEKLLTIIASNHQIVVDDIIEDPDLEVTCNHELKSGRYVVHWRQ